MKTRLLASVLICTLPIAVIAATYRCNVDGKMIYSQVQCAPDAATLHMDPPPTDSLDNPEAAERYRKKKEQEEHERQVLQEMERRELERSSVEAYQRQIEENRLRHEQALESKLDDIKKEMKRARRQQHIDSLREQQEREFDRIQRNQGMTCRPGGFGDLRCN